MQRRAKNGRGLLLGALQAAVLDGAREEVVAVIIGNGDRPTIDAIISHCKKQLANFKIPKRVEVIDSLPRNAMGKVQKNLLRERFSTP